MRFAIGTAKGIALSLVVCASGCLETSSETPPTETEKKQEAAAEIIVVTVAPVVTRPVQRTVGIVGTLKGHDEVTITPKVEGRIVRIYKDVGDVVRPGDPLMDIDPTDYQLMVDEAAEGLDLELAKLGLKQPPQKDFDPQNLPSVSRTRFLEENALARLERAKKLHESNSLGKENLELLETDYKVAKATRSETVLVAESTLASARYRQALLASARQRLSETKIVVPKPTITPDFAAGPSEYVVSRRLVSEGEMIRAFPSVPVCKLVMDRPLKLLAGVPERFSAEVKVGQEIRLKVEAWPDRIFEAKIARIDPTIEPVNRTFRIEALAPNDKRELRAGGFAKALIFTRVDPAARTASPESIVTFAGVSKVFAVVDNHAKAVAVTTGIRGKDWIEIAGDLPDNAVVVTSGQSRLVDGQPVRIRSENQPSAQGGKQPESEKIHVMR